MRIKFGRYTVIPQNSGYLATDSQDVEPGSPIYRKEPASLEAAEEDAGSLAAEESAMAE